MEEDIRDLVKKKKKHQKDGNVKQLAEVLKQLGDLYYDKKHLEDALQAYKEQLHACECLANKLNCAIAHRMIGEVYADMGNFQEALKHENLYLGIAKELKNLIEEQRAFATLGRTHLLIADTLVKESEKDKKMEVLMDAKKAFSKSIKLCDKLENTIDVKELMTMRARLLLNLGIIFEQQKKTEQALEFYKMSASICKEHNLSEDLHRTNMAFAGINERLGKTELAMKNLDEAAKVDDIHLKSEAKLAKSELLLRQGEWMEAQKILHSMYKNKRLSEFVKEQVTKLLRIAVVLCRTDDELLMVDDCSKKEELYDRMGDAAIAVRALDKAAYYYKQMLECAEKTKSDKLAAALTSLSQTLKDAGKFEEAIPYARRELELCSDPKDACNSALFIAKLLIDSNSSNKEIRKTFDRALELAKDANDTGLERVTIKRLIEHLQKMEDVDLQQIEDLNEKLESLPVTESQELLEEEEGEYETPDIGADICLDELSDAESETAERPRPNIAKSLGKRHRCVIKKNEKGETQLHVACIKGNIQLVEKLLEEHHPTSVRDNVGWTPLHEVANHGHIEIAKLLIRAGAEVNDPGGINCDGITPMHDAAANGHTAMVQLLLDSGANPNLLNSHGDTALHCLEQWRQRVEDLSSKDLQDYVLVKRRLISLTKVKNKKKKRKEDEGPRWNALIDEEEDAWNNDRLMDTWTKPSKPEKISAGEDYKRTIASMQRPGRNNLPTNQPALPKITAPLIDSEDMLVDEDWLEDDLGLFAGGKKKEKMIPDGLLPIVGGSSAPVKRKSKSEAEREADKSMKRQKISLSLKEKQPPALMPVDEEDSCDSNASEPIYEPFKEIDNWPKKKKPRQTNLLRIGFTKNINNRSPSPTNSVSPEPIYAPTISRIESEKRSWDSGNFSDVLNLEIQVNEESFDLKLHFRDLKKTLNGIEEIIRNKFEVKAGFKPRLKFKTMDGVTLASEIVVEEIPRDSSNKLKLYGEIVPGELPPIVDRYKKVCETFNVDVSESMLKSLRSCGNTSTFRLNSNGCIDEEIEPLLKCIQYQKNLQVLNLSSAVFFDAGDLLNQAISKMENLCELHLQCCDINFECLSLIEKLPLHLRVLDLSYNPLGSESQKKLYDLLQPLRYLQTLNLKSCELNDFTFRYLSHSLINLDISWNPIGGQGAANFLQRQLLSLNLSNTQNSKGKRKNVIDEIFFNDTLGFKFHTLESLDLSNSGATDLDVDKILSNTPNLSRIKLSNNINVTKTSLCALLARKPTMTLIDLSGCSFIDELPDTNLRIVTPQVCTLLVNMKIDVIDSWEKLWQGRGLSRKLPHCLIVFKPI